MKQSTQDTERKQTKQKNSTEIKKRISNTDPPQQQMVNTSDREAKAVPVNI